MRLIQVFFFDDDDDDDDDGFQNIYFLSKKTFNIQSSKTFTIKKRQGY